jgi:hypothetical protein
MVIGMIWDYGLMKEQFGVIKYGSNDSKNNR